MSEVIRLGMAGNGQEIEVVEPGDWVALPEPEAGVPIVIREAVEGDLGFIDGLQKGSTKAVGWMPTGQLAGHIKKGHVLVAECLGQDMTGGTPIPPGSKQQTGDPPPSPSTRDPAPTPVGYCIGVDKYFKREDVGVIYQMNIAPGRRRGKIGALLLRAMFDRSAYGVRLFCCWCAQDLEANRFWEAMGFVPLAFRAGSRKRGRVHIFWQKPIRAEDALEVRRGSFRGWWYPSQTGGGAIREDRIVLPIPPGVHWSEAKPRVLPGAWGVERLFGEVAAERRALESRERKPREGKAARAARKRAEAAARAAEAARAKTVAAGGLRFAPGSLPAAPGEQAGGEPTPPEPGARHAGGTPVRPKSDPPKPAKAAKKNDPRLVALSRELRDRWLEAVRARPGELIAGRGAKYDVCRRIGGGAAGGAGGVLEVGAEAVAVRRLDAM